MSSDAKATFTANLDTGGVQSGASKGITALEALRARVQKTKSAFDSIKGSLANLKNTLSVQRFEALTKSGGELQKAQSDVDKLRKKYSELQETLAIAKQANVSESDLSSIRDQMKPFEEAEARLKRLQGELENLKGDKAVQSFIDQSDQAKALGNELGDLTQKYLEAGGSAGELGEKVEQPTGALGKLLAQAKGAGGPLGEFASKLEGLGSAAKLAGPLAVLAVVIAIAAAAIKAGYALAKMALVAADAARNAARQRSAAAFGSGVGQADIESTIRALRANTALAKGEAQGLAIELYRAGERGKNLEDAALTIERFGQLGDDAKSSVKGLYDELRKPTPAVGGGMSRGIMITKDMLPRDVFLDLANQLGKDGQRALLTGFTADKAQVRAALSRIGENRFAGPALEQMRSLDKLAERLHENIQGLFSGLKVGVFLGALQKIVNLLDETSESGKALKETISAFAQPFADLVESALPYVEAFFEGLIAGALSFAIAAIDVKNALSKMIPESLTKNIDWLNVAFWTGILLVGTFAAGMVLLGLAILTLLSPLLLVGALIISIGAAILWAVDQIVGWFDEVSEAFEGVSFADAVEGITDGIIKAVQDGAADVWKAFVDLAKGGLDAFKGALGIKSPSKVFRLAAREIPRGAALGVDDEADKLDAAAAAMTGPDALDTSSAKANGKGEGGVVTKNYYVTVNGVKDANEMNSGSFIRHLAAACETIASQGAQPIEVPS